MVKKRTIFSDLKFGTLPTLPVKYMASFANLLVNNTLTLREDGDCMRLPQSQHCYCYI